MKTETYQTSPKGRSTKADNAGLSLQHLQLFTVVNDTYKYYNEIVKNVSNFLGRLTAKKFDNVTMVVLGSLTKHPMININVWTIKSVSSNNYRIRL